MYFRTSNGIKEHKEGEKWYDPAYTVEHWEWLSTQYKEHPVWTPAVMTLIVIAIGIIVVAGYQYMKKK